MTAATGTEEFAANLALGHCGQPEIAAMSDDSTRGRAVRQLFPTIRDGMLRRKWWTFATSWVVPSADTLVSSGPLKIRYPLPDDCLRVRFLEDIADDAWALEGAVATIGATPVEANILVTNTVAPNVCYTRRVTEVRLWDGLFLEAFAFELGSALAKKLGRGTALASDLHSQSEGKLNNAAGVDSKEKSRREPRPEPSVLSARRGYRAYPYRS